MKTYWLLAVVLLVGLIIPTNATQYNPPWAHNFGFHYLSPPWSQDLDTRTPATNAANYQSIVGYNTFNLPDSGAYLIFNKIKDDAVFFFIGHSNSDPNDPGGALIFFNGTTSYLIAEDKGYQVIGDHYYLSSTSSELSDLLLAVYVGCYSGGSSSKWGNLVEMTHQKGVDNVIGFSKNIYFPYCAYWSDRFWYRCLYGQAGGHQTIKNAGDGAVADVMMRYHSFYGLQYKYGIYQVPYTDYLDPARYGVI